MFVSQTFGCICESHATESILQKEKKKPSDAVKTVAVFVIAHKNHNYNNTNETNDRMKHKNIYKVFLNVITLVKCDALEMNQIKFMVFYFFLNLLCTRLEITTLKMSGNVIVNHVVS